MQAARVPIAPWTTYINSYGGSSGPSMRAAHTARTQLAVVPDSAKSGCSSGKKRRAAFDYKAAARQRLGWGAGGDRAVAAAPTRAAMAADDTLTSLTCLRVGSLRSRGR